MQLLSSAGKYTFEIKVRAVPSPMAFRARTITPKGAGISGFGNTRADAIRDLQSRVENYVAMIEQNGWDF